MSIDLPFAESFFSIQGEGPTQGVPAVFLRLGGCNLQCGSKPGATWICDTLDVWKNFKTVTSDELIRNWTEKGWIDKLADNAHLVITGGEPLLHKEKIYRFIEELPVSTYVEVETNGTIPIDPKISGPISQYNISPKLENSGEPREKRINSEVLSWFPGNCSEVERQANFKFVITSQSDWEEVKRDFITPYEIPRRMIWLMAGAESREALISRNQMVAELAIRECVNFSNRIQIQIWDKKRGV